MTDGEHAGPLLAAAAAVALGTAVVPVAATAQSAAPERPDYPDTKTVDVVDDYHGTRVDDPYRWLEDTYAADTEAWVEAQNELTFSYLASVPERDAIRSRLRELWNYERYGVPWKEGGRYFYFKNDGLQDQPVLYSLPELGEDPRTLLDPNRFSEDGTVALTEVEASPDGRFVGYGISEGGSDWQTFRVREIDSGEDLEHRVEWVKFSGLAWTEDSEGFFYARYPEPGEEGQLLAENRNQEVYYHRVGTPQSEDVLVHADPEHPEWGYGVTVTEDGRYLVMDVSYGTDEKNAVYYVDLGDPAQPTVDGEVVRLLDERDASYDFVGNDGPVFYFVTDLDAPRGRLIAVDTRRPAREHWREVVPEGRDVLQDADVIAGRLVAEYLHDAHSRVRIFDPEGTEVDEVDLPALGSVETIRGRDDGDEMFYSFTSYLYPTTVFRYDFGMGESEVFRAPEVDFDPDDYVTRQVFYESKDGTRIPMFLTHRKGLERDGSNPTLLYGYGGFDIPVTPGFSVADLVWLEMGGVYAVANIRGGGEYGETWHEAGMLGKKQNVFDDYIAAAEHLIGEGWTSREKLAIEGGSNGGLLVGAVMTQRPELFGAALPAVGVMDMLRYHEFTIGWAWVPEYGSSEDPEAFEWLYEYSPYHNLEAGTCYPATLVTTADHDDRVVPGHSFKFAARLQAVQSCAEPTLIRIETRAGHGGGTPVSKAIEQAADRWAFLVENLGMEVAPD